jgi:hypothetical protein
MGHPPDAGRGINPFLNYEGGEGALLTQAGRGLAAIKEEIEKNGTGVFVLCCVCGNVCVAFVCVCCGKLKKLHTLTLDRRGEGMHGLRAQQGSGKQRHKVPKQLDARLRPKDGQGATGRNA